MYCFLKANLSNVFFQHREQINSDHRLKYLLDVSYLSFQCLFLFIISFLSQRHTAATEAIVELYEDKDGVRKDEIATMSGPNEFSEFYKRVKLIKDQYKDNPNEVGIPVSHEFDEFLKARENETTLVDFTDEEGYGKFLDLNECFHKYLNLKGMLRIDYLTYLHMFDRLFEISKDKKTQADYKKYIEALLEYLTEFCAKVKPLLNIKDVSC